MTSEEHIIHEYNCDYDIKMSYGKYIWCGKTSSPTGSGFTLTNIDDSTNLQSYGYPYTYMMLLKFTLSDKLYRDTDFYDMYDHTGFLCEYNLGPVKQTNITFKKIKDEQIGTEIDIVFSKTKQLSEEEYNAIRKSFRRIPRDEIYRIKIKIPELTQYDNTCLLCLEDVDNPENKYITHCGHLFHLNCIFEYFERNNLLYPLYPHCSQFCCNTKKIKPFECIVCKSIIIK